MRFLRRGVTAALVTFALAAPAMAQSGDPSFRLNNNSGVAINEVYVSSANDNSWGVDRDPPHGWQARLHLAPDLRRDRGESVTGMGTGKLIHAMPEGRSRGSRRAPEG